MAGSGSRPEALEDLLTGRTDTNLLEREADVKELGRVLADARAGRGGLAIIEGAPGAGKSELVAAARRQGAAAGLRVLSASGSEFEREFAFGAVRQLFEPVLEASGAGRDGLLAGAAAPAQWVVSPADDPNGGRGQAGFVV